jgi:predicted helicase
MSIDIKPNHKPIKEYYEELASFEKHGHSNEMTVRNAFQDLLQTYTKKIGWQFIEEYTIKRKDRKNASVDGALLDQFSLPRGFWEAKDSKDDLPTEITKKFADGYPQTNILFWQPGRAILFQDGRQILDEDISNPKTLVEVLSAFFEYDQPYIKEWEHAVEEFKNTIPTLAKSVLRILEDQRSSNRAFQQSFDTFMTLVQQSINPSLSIEAVEEMLIQHLLTRRIFTTIFNAPGFLQQNAVARELEGVIATLVQGYGSTVEDFLRPLDRFYKALELAAGATDDFSQKQTFLNHVYEKFFQGFAVKVADTHGIVYTPQPIVDFMVKSVEASLQKDFGKSLASEGVHILDPFVGTGNFILRVIREIHEQNPRVLRHKYQHELHCNELMILPYYIACLNIEHLYYELTGEYLAFPGICLVDTFELAEDRQMGMFTSQNTDRVQKQKESPIFVVIGNPPYNAGQVNENDNNKNRKYPVMDKRVQETYVKVSTATYRADLNDPYVKAFRYASDKIIANGEGIVCMVTNNGFLDGIAFDGMRKHLMQDFSTVRIIDLKGNIRKDSMRDGIPLGEEHTVFGLGAMVGISIALCEKKRDSQDHNIEYWDTHFRSKRIEKFSELEKARTWFGLPSRMLQPNAKNVWLTEGMAEDWDSLMSLGSKEGKSGKALSLFTIYSLGILTNRDRWVYRFSHTNLYVDMIRMSDEYNDHVARWPLYSKEVDINFFVNYDDKKVAWSRDLKLKVKRNRIANKNTSYLRISHYRPFVKQHVYFNPTFIDQALKFPRIFPLLDSENIVICLSAIGQSKPFHTIAVNVIPDLHLTGDSQCFPFYVYDEDGTNRRDNITDWGLEQFQNHYSDSTISKMDIFHYVYGLLHDPRYREKYAANLKRELPRIPFAKHFRVYAKAGKKLMDMHLHYEEQERYPVKEEWSLPKGYIHPHGIPVNSIEQVPLHERYAVSKMKRDRNDSTKLIYNDFLTLTGIPSSVDHYMLGNRSALNWIIDQYQVSVDKRSGIVNDPNEYCKEINNPRYIVELIQSVITLSMNTNKIVNALPKDGFGE